MASPLSRVAKLIRGLSDLTGLTPLIDRFISQSEILTIEGKKYVRKRYLKEVGIIKWIPPATLFRANYPFTLSPKERFQREVKFMEHEWSGFKVPKIVNADSTKLEIIREYVDGVMINYNRNAEDLAKALGDIHRSGWALGDVKPTNFIMSNTGWLYVIDAEQAISESSMSHRAWDLALTVFFAAYSNLPDLSAYGSFLNRFLSNYVNTYGNDEVIRKLSSFQFGGIFLLMPLPHVFMLADAVESIINQG